MKRTRLIAALLIAAMLLTLALPGMAASVLQKGDTGDDVTKMQERLIELGYLEGQASGVFDDETEAALIAFQKRSRLLATGMADRITWDALFSENAKANRKAEKNTQADYNMAMTEEAYSAGMAPGLSYSVPMATAMPSASMTAAESSWDAAWDGGWDIPWNTNEYTLIKEYGF